MTDIMVDLETLSTRPTAVILSIGACTFDRKTGMVGKTFYQTVTRASCEKYGLHVSKSTLEWWRGQSDEAKAALLVNRLDLPEALALFAAWINTLHTEPLVWGNGASFDNAILAHAFDVVGMELPWKFWNDRCYRTIKGLHPLIKLPPRAGVHHNALDDARTQAVHCAAILKAMGKA